MNRRCYHCGRNLDNEPALAGAHGMLCFPCRYRLDEAGGEEYVKAKAEFDNAYATWERQFGSQWKRYQTRRSWEELISGASVLALVATIVLVFTAPNFRPAAASAGIMVVLWLCSGLAHWYAARARCMPPPLEPAPKADLLSGKPKLIFDDSAQSPGSPQFDKYQGYPPDWEQRRQACLARDGYVCRLCGSSDRSNVHHVWPVSFSSTHTLQNLISLCHMCHFKQKYWDHKALVEANIHANRKYDVQGYTRKDGVVVKGHKRKIGRRGNFWKGVRQTRENPDGWQ